MAVKKDTTTGKWYFYGKYNDVNGISKQYKKRGFNTKSDAKNSEHLFLISNKETSLYINFDDLFLEYIHFIKNKSKSTTIFNCERNYNKHIKDALGKKRVNKITTKDIIALHNKMKENGYKVTYINTIHGLINRIFNYAIKVKNHTENPASKVGFVKDKDTIKEEMKIWTIKDYKNFISVIDDQRYIILYTLAYMTGARRGELLALTWNDFDEKGININKTCSKIKGGYIITPPKTNASIRYVNLDRNTIIMLKNYKLVISKTDGFKNDWFILGNNKPLSFTRVRERMITYCELANVEKIRFHDIRHSNASLLINSGMKITAIARRLGHSSEMLLQVYAHFFKEDEKEIIDFLDKL